MRCQRKPFGDSRWGLIEPGFKVTEEAADLLQQATTLFAVEYVQDSLILMSHRAQKALKEKDMQFASLLRSADLSALWHEQSARVAAERMFQRR